MGRNYVEIASDSLIAAWRQSVPFLRGTTGVILFFFLWLNVHPAVAAVKDAVENPATLFSSKSATVVSGPDAQRATVEALRQSLQRMNAALTKHRDRVIKQRGKDGTLHITILGTPADVDLTEPRKQIARIQEQFAEQDRQAEADFQKDLAHIQAKHLPTTIQQRHAQALADYRKERDALHQSLDTLEKGRDLATLIAQTEDLLQRTKHYLPQQVKLDPNNLPFKVQTEKARKPKLREQDFDRLFREMKVPVKRTAQTEPLMVASAGALTGLLATAALTPPGPEYLAATDDVQITPEIQALAAELKHHPVTIYNWVRNHIEWIPSYGSVQGSQLTLDKKAGNAFDTASLLIALLRASNIPARYAYGAVEIPIEKVMNWAGGFTDPDAALTFLATGGIPVAGLVRGGKVSAIQMEQVWVEAFVDFFPSRGAKNFVPDSWVPMDANFKQYTYTAGMDLQNGAPFNAEDFLSQAQQGATINEQEGWVQNLNQANIQAQLNQYQQQLQDFIQQQNPDATVGQVLGSKTIQPLNAPQLAATLPYHRIAQGQPFASLPSALRHKFRYSLYLDEHQRSIENPLFSYETPTTSLAGKKVTLAFVPATEDDRKTIESYLPKPHEDGSPIRPEEFPSSLPAYSIHVKAELRVEGNMVATGGSFTLGQELLGEGGFTQLTNLSDWDLTTDPLVAGQTGALGISLHGLAATQLSQLKDRLQATKAKLDASDFTGLTGEHLSGELLTATVWSYFAAVESFGTTAQRQAKVVDAPGLSYGFFHAQVVPIKRYGVVMQARFPGVLLDIGHQRRIAFAKTNDTAGWINYNRLRGQHSSTMEHAIPERFFDDPNDGQIPEGVSAVKALAVAVSQGQKIYSVTQANQAQLANLKQSSAMMENIRAAINAGKEVTAHERPISHGGFNGAGYIITDPQTGGGAYLIEGGSRGGALLDVFISVTSAIVDSLLIYKTDAEIAAIYPSGSFVKTAGNLIAKFFAIIFLVKSVKDTVENDQLNLLQKQGIIFANLLASMAGVAIGNALTAGLAVAPLYSILLWVLLVALLITAITALVTYLIAGMGRSDGGKDSAFA